VQLRDEAPDLRGIERGHAPALGEPQQLLHVACVQREAARREAPLVLERAEVLAQRGLVGVRGAPAPSRACARRAPPR
jgi:hypothetical protein